MPQDKQASVLSLNQLFWFKDENYSRAGSFFDSEAQEKELIGYLFPGWNSGLGRPLVTKMTPEEQKKALGILQAEYEALKAAPISSEPLALRLAGESVSISMAEMLQVWEKTYLDSKKAIRTPEYKAASCFRRGSVLLKVNAARAKAGKELITSLPVEVRTWGNTLEQVIECVQENVLKTAGSKGLREADLLNACRKAFQFGATQADFRRIFGIKEGLSQRYHRTCQLDAKYPDQNVIGRIMSGEVQFRQFEKEAVKKILDANVSKDELEAWLKSPKKNAPKSMARKGIEALAKQCPVTLVALTAQAILADDVKALAHIIAKFEAVNKAVEAALKV